MKEFVVSIKADGSKGFSTQRVFASSAAQAREKVEHQTQKKVVAVMSASVYDEVMATQDSR